MLLGNRHEARRAVDLAGRGMHHLLHPEIEHRLQHVQRALDIGVDVAVRCLVRIGDRDQRRQVQHRATALYRAAHRVSVADVAGHHLHVLAQRCRQRVQPAPGIEGVVMDHGAHVVALVQQAFDQVRADKSGGAGDEDFLAGEVHWSFLWAFNAGGAKAAEPISRRNCTISRSSASYSATRALRKLKVTLAFSSMPFGVR